MRVERHNGPPDLQKAFEHLVVQRLRGQALDEYHAKESREGRFPDFVCFRNLLLIEMKHLETEQQDRLDAVVKAMIDPIEQPFFFGKREMSFTPDTVVNATEINAALMGKLGRTIEQLLRHANHQFGSYRTRNPRKNSVSVCVILNSRLREFSPEIVIHAVHGKMKASRIGGPRFPEIDAILYISEKHYQRLQDGRLAFAIATYAAAGTINHQWKMQVVERLVDEWVQMRTGSVVETSNLKGFKIVDDIPRTMRRYEKWQLEYRREPYLQNHSINELRVLFFRAIAMNLLAFASGSWRKPSQAEAMEGMRKFQHIIEESNRRNLGHEPINGILESENL